MRVRRMCNHQWLLHQPDGHSARQIESPTPQRLHRRRHRPVRLAVQRGVKEESHEGNQQHPIRQYPAALEDAGQGRPRQLVTSRGATKSERHGKELETRRSSLRSRHRRDKRTCLRADKCQRQLIFEGGSCWRYDADTHPGTSFYHCVIRSCSSKMIKSHVLRFHHRYQNQPLFN